MRKFLLSVAVAVFVFSASLVNAAQVMVKDFQAEKGTVSVWKIAKALNHPGWTGVNALRKSNPNFPPLEKIKKILDIRIFPNTRITIPEDWSYEGIDRSVVDPVIDPKNKFSFKPLLAAEGFNSPEGTAADIDNQNKDYHPLWLISKFIRLDFLAAFLLFVILLVTFLSLWKNRQMTIIAGQSIIPGGITPDRPQEIEDRFNRIAERRYGEVNPQADLSVERPVRISPIEAGFLNGHGTVVHRDKPRKEKMKNEPGFRARYRFPNGNEEELLFKQACGNDVYAGTRYRGFTFTASRVIVPAPAPVIKTQPNSTQQETTETTTVEKNQTTTTAAVSSVTKNAADEAAPETTEETQLTAATSETAETVKTTETAVTKEVVAAEVAQTPKKVKITVGGISIEVVGNGKVPTAKIEMEDGTTVFLQQQ